MEKIFYQSAAQVNLIFYVLIIFGIGLRIHFWLFQPLNFDELIQYDLLMRMKDLYGVLEYNLFNDYQFPLVYSVTYYLVKIFGAELWSFRLFSVVLSGLGWLLFHKILIEKYEDKKIVLAAHTCFAISIPLIWYSTNARPYSTLITSYLFTQYFDTKDFSQKKIRINFYLGLLLLSLTHLFGLILSSFLFCRKHIKTIQAKTWPKVSLALVFLLFAFAIAVKITPLVDKQLPSFKKLLGLTPFLTNGFPLFFGIGILWWKNQSLRRLRNLDDFWLILLSSLLLTLLGAPAFEWRFFIFLSPLLILFLVDTFSILNFKNQVQYLALPVAFLLGMGWYLPQILNSIQTPQVFERLKTLSLNKVLSCGNCPSFYGERYNIQVDCLGGWDLSKGNELKSGKNALIIYNQNIRFCEKHIPENFKEDMTVEGLSLYFSK